MNEQSITLPPEERENLIATLTALVTRVTLLEQQMATAAQVIGNLSEIGARNTETLKVVHRILGERPNGGGTQKQIN